MANKKRMWCWIGAGSVALAGVGYVGTALYYADKIPAQTRVAGVKIGGMNPEEASALLTSKLAGRLDEPVTVEAGGKSTQIKPQDFSAKFSPEKTLDSLTGFSLNPARVWNNVTGGGDVAAVVDVDQKKLKDTLATTAKELNTEPADAKVTFNGTTPAVTPAVKGIAVDEDDALRTLPSRLLGSQPVELKAASTEPAITDERANAAVKEIAEPLVSDSLAINVADKLVTITPEQLVSVASIVNTDGALTLFLDPKGLGDIVRAGAGDSLRAGQDAKVEIIDHITPKITPSVNGVGIDDADLATKAQAAAVTTKRTVNISTVETKPAFSTEDAQKLGITEVVSAIETPLTSDSVRTKNLVRGTQLINNTLIKPGEEFSLLGALGPITKENGFYESGVVANGFNSTALGGGISQLSTNTFNIAYLAGFDDLEHKPHSKYFKRYPMGREATLWEGQIDMRFKNDTPYGAIIDTWVAGGKVHSQMWSTKYYEVTTSTSAPRAFVQPTSKKNNAPDCEPSGAGDAGFTVTVSRQVKLDGTVKKDESYNWTYQPVDAVTCE